MTVMCSAGFDDVTQLSNVGGTDVKAQASCESGQVQHLQHSRSPREQGCHGWYYTVSAQRRVWRAFYLDHLGKVTADAWAAGSKPFSSCADCLEGGNLAGLLLTRESASVGAGTYRPCPQDGHLLAWPNSCPLACMHCKSARHTCGQGMRLSWLRLRTSRTTCCLRICHGVLDLCRLCESCAR